MIVIYIQRNKLDTYHLSHTKEWTQNELKILTLLKENIGEMLDHCSKKDFFWTGAQKQKSINGTILKKLCKENNQFIWKLFIWQVINFHNTYRSKQK